jgi:hypothetical protein
MFNNASPSATDAAALGMAPQPRVGIGLGLVAPGMMGMGMGMSGTPNGGVLVNPMAGSTLSGGMSPASARQMGLMTLAAQAQMTGIGSGQLSGVRPGASSGGRTRQQAIPKARGSASTPGGLAARYFNRTTGVGRQRQSYYNRQNPYFPQVAR